MAVSLEALVKQLTDSSIIAPGKLENFIPPKAPPKDAGQVGAAHFLVMEFVDGKDLSAIVKQDGPFPVGKAVNYIVQAARGLEFLNQLDATLETQDTAARESLGWQELCHSLLASNEFLFRI